MEIVVSKRWRARQQVWYRTVCLLSLLLGACDGTSAGTSAGVASPPGDSPALVVRSADARLGIDATYRENGRTVILRARPTSTEPDCAITDETGRSLLEHASEVYHRPRTLRQSSGVRITEVAQLFRDAKEFTATSALLQHAFTKLREEVPRDVFRSPLFDALRAQKHLVDRALAVTRVSLLLEWRDEAHRHLLLTDEETAKFNAIFAERAREVWKKGSQSTSVSSDELATLLGPERYQRYAALQEQWFAPIKARVAEVAP